MKRPVAGMVSVALPMVLLSGLAFAPPILATEPDHAAGRATAMNALIEHRLDDPRIGDNVSLIVIDGETGEVLSGHAPNRRMRAASNMKIVTAATALATMDRRTRFTTKVFAGARPGHVILQGAGDPLLSAADIAGLASQTAREVGSAGAVVVHVDGDLFPAPSSGPGWTDGYDRYRLAAVQALAIRGDISEHPSLNAALLFAASLRFLGLDARVGSNEDAQAGARVLARSSGHTVGQAVHVMLRESESNVAEVLFRQVALASGHKGTWAGGIAAAYQALAGLGVDTTGVSLLDGSGLSRKDRLTTAFLAALLRVVRIAQHERFSAMFAANAMPIAGVSGTLTTAYGRYDTWPSRCAAGRIQAKTGTLYDVIALSGITMPDAGPKLIFSMIVNEPPTAYSKLATRRALDGLAATMVGCW
ncbi:MAG: D-alanyl-D-alanine carboxypeptidase/D-alanyl-D-alanine-endopeptidase [Actinomycetota bacterium]|nr:D-alanyl-D-alanine carboxypeptidase/D-alanyl-D-alanine-endopeptidase [Actinomycetota bacterium]